MKMPGGAGGHNKQEGPMTNLRSGWSFVNPFSYGAFHDEQNIDVPFYNNNSAFI
jgi:hypothetical protein